MVGAYLLTPAGCVFSWALDRKLWECLCRRNPGWCCLYCSVSASVWNQRQQKTTIVFCFRTHVRMRAGTGGFRRSLITPSLPWPRFLTLHQFTPCLHLLPFAPTRAVYGSALQWISTQRSRWICKCYSRWNSCGVMDVSISATVCVRLSYWPVCCFYPETFQ